VALTSGAIGMLRRMQDVVDRALCFEARRP
jgi:hypothetical protein